MCEVIDSNVTCVVSAQVKLQEEALTAEAVSVWTEEILPEFSIKKDTKKCRELWWRGLPPSVRGKVWSLAVGNSLNVSEHLYDLLQERSVYRKINYNKVNNNSMNRA